MCNSRQRYVKTSFCISRKDQEFVCNEDVLILITLSPIKIALLLKLEKKLIQNISWKDHYNLKLKTQIKHDFFEPIK